MFTSFEVTERFSRNIELMQKAAGVYLRVGLASPVSPPPEPRMVPRYNIHVLSRPLSKVLEDFLQNPY